MRRVPDIIGRSPVSPPLLIIGKVSYLGCVLFFLATVFGGGDLPGGIAVVRGAGIVLFAVGLAALIAAIVQLGRSLAVGFPERETELRTTGIYGLSRNPIYTGAFMMCGGSCIVAPHLLNIALCAVAIAVHLRVVAKEEEFLERRFGQAWLAYKAAVPRYVGIRRHG